MRPGPVFLEVLAQAVQAALDPGRLRGQGRRVTRQVLERHESVQRMHARRAT